MDSRPYALDIVIEAMECLVLTGGSLIDRVDRAYGVLHPVIALRPDAAWEAEHTELVRCYSQFLDRGDGVMKAGLVKSHHTKRQSGARALMDLQLALLRISNQAGQ
jgi:hypothetical protein